jgi:hypothetical protein
MIALELAEWAAGLQPSDDDLSLARRALIDTVAVSVAAHGDPLLASAQPFGPGGRLAAAARTWHVAAGFRRSSTSVGERSAVGGG